MLSEKMIFLVHRILLGAITWSLLALCLIYLKQKMKKCGHIKGLYLFIILSLGISLVPIIGGILTPFFHEIILVERWSWYVWGTPHIYKYSSMSYAFGLIWGLGVIYQIYSTIKQYLHTKIIEDFNEEIVQVQLINLIEQMGMELQLKRIPEVYFNSKVRTPFLKGVFKPQIIVPQKILSKDGWKMILAHELVHEKRNDLLVRVIFRVVSVVFWFTPVNNWWMKEVIEVQESLCDITVCQQFGSCFSAAEYYNFILEYTCEKKNDIVSPSWYQQLKMGESVSQLEYRIKNMYGYQLKNGHIKKWAVLSGGMIFFVLLAVTAVFYLPEPRMQQSNLVDSVTGNFTAAFIEREYIPDDKKTIHTEQEFIMPNVMESYEIKAGEMLSSEEFQGKKGQKLALAICASSDRYELGLKTSDSVIQFVNEAEEMDAEYELQDGRYQLYVQNTGMEPLEITIFFIK